MNRWNKRFFCMLTQIQETGKLLHRFFGGHRQKWAWLLAHKTLKSTVSQEWIDELSTLFYMLIDTTICWTDNLILHLWFLTTGGSLQMQLFFCFFVVVFFSILTTVGGLSMFYLNKLGDLLKCFSWTFFKFWAYSLIYFPVEMNFIWKKWYLLVPWWILSGSTA